MAPDNNNGRGIKLPFKMSELLSGASSIVSVVVVLIGLVVWSARQEGRIGELEHRVQVDNERLADLDRRGTREMAERVGIVNEHVETLKASFNEMQKRLEVVNSTGSQAGLLLAERVANDERQATLTRERVQALDIRNSGLPADWRRWI